MSGVYICKAHNEVGSAQCNVTLEVSTGQLGVSVVKEKVGQWWGRSCERAGRPLIVTGQGTCPGQMSVQMFVQ